MKFSWNIHEGGEDDVVKYLLERRGVTTESEIASFLYPKWEEHIHDPFIFTRMQDACDRLLSAFEKGENILIHGDYDADGISGATLLYTGFKDVCEKLGFTPSINVFLPDREKDGYGIAMHTIERLGKEKVDLLVTVDCGISNADQLDRAHELGIDSIVCDHHQMGDRLPEHAMLIHPLVPGETYPNKTLCGTGVAFKLICGLITEAKKLGADFPEGYEKWFLDLVAIATVTDVMPLIGENRVLEKFGLIVLNKTRRLGIQKIVEVSRSKMGSLDTQAIGFQIGPRINAAGRIQSAETSFKALSATTEEEAQKYADELEMLNRERRRISDASYREARATVKERGDAPVHVVWDETWNPGIVGLIAGKLVTEFGVPAFALTKVGDHWVGSGRSIGGLHLVEAMKSCGDIFIKAGGHPQACGLSIENLDLIQKFQDGVQVFAKEYFGEDLPKPSLEVELVLPMEKVDWELLGNLDRFEPFGEKNPKPLILSKSVKVMSAETMGKHANHLRLTVTPVEGDVRKMVGFGFGKYAEKLVFDDLVDVVYELGINEWNGNRELQMRIVDLKKVE
jgi:single-stranded-DNA-specific exonuclease